MKENDQPQQKAVRSRHCLAAMEAGKHRIAMSDAAGKPGQRNDRRRDVERQHHREKRLERIQQRHDDSHRFAENPARIGSTKVSAAFFAYVFMKEHLSNDQRPRHRSKQIADCQNKYDFHLLSP